MAVLIRSGVCDAKDDASHIDFLLNQSIAKKKNQIKKIGRQNLYEDKVS